MCNKRGKWTVHSISVSDMTRSVRRIIDRLLLKFMHINKYLQLNKLSHATCGSESTVDTLRVNRPKLGNNDPHKQVRGVEREWKILSFALAIAHRLLVMNFQI